jgi:hypothetical protein
MKAYAKSRGAWIDSALLDDATVPATPAVTSIGPTNFPVHQLRFRASAYKGTAAFASLKWRLAEVLPKGAVLHPGNRGLYEITATWESPESDQPEEIIQVPSTKVKPGHCYRVRVRVKDVVGRWSHWSAPVQFLAGAK